MNFVFREIEIIFYIPYPERNYLYLECDNQDKDLKIELTWCRSDFIQLSLIISHLNEAHLINCMRSICA